MRFAPGHGINTSGMKRVALQQAAGRKPQPAEHSILTDRSTRIFGAGRVKAAAGGQKGGDANLIGTDQDDKKSSHNLRE